MANGIIKSVRTWSWILVVGFSVINLIGCDSNNFPKSWAEFKAFNPFNPKSGVEIAVRRHFASHSNHHDGNIQFTGTLHTSFGESVDIWELRNFDVAITTLAKVSEADRLNGIEGQATFQVTCSAYRQRALYPKESKEWSLWKDGGQILKGDAVKQKGVWAIQVFQDALVGGSEQVSIEDSEHYKMPEAGKRLAEVENQEKKLEPTLTSDPGSRAVATKETEGINRDKLPKKLAAMIQPYTESRFFDSHTHVFEGSYETVWQAVERTLKSRKDKVIASDQTAGTLMTDLSRHGILGAPVHDKFCIYLESVDSNHTRIEFVLFSFGMNSKLLMVPVTDKEFVAKRAQKFLDLVEASLKPKT